MLKYGSLDPVMQRGDYDVDDDGLIEVYTLAQLNAIRWDLDGNGATTSGNAARYGKAFVNHATGMGCPSTCTGYELANDLDFDTDGDDSTHINGVGDPGDSYYNSGAGFSPIGTRSAPFSATFDGQGKIIDNLFVNRATTGSSGRDTALFGGTDSSAVIMSVGLRDAWVASASSGAAALVGRNGGRVAAVWASGAVSGTSGVGGLVGSVSGSASVIVASYSTASVTITAATGGQTQRGFSNGGGTVVASYWDTTIAGIADDADADAPEGRAAARLRAPTEYGSVGLYATWDDEDVDGDSTAGEATDDDA